MKFFIVTAFPKSIQGALNESILKRASEKEIATIELVDLRDFTDDKHKQVDDYPFGGGPGMVLKPEPFFRAVDYLKTEKQLLQPLVVLMTPQGRKFDQGYARELSRRTELILLCGHYKGVDERVREYLVTEEISIGDYILTGGELPAVVVADAVVRLLPGVISDIDSALTDSFERGSLDCSYYTRPENFDGMRVPEVLLSGNHAEIQKWRESSALKRTLERRRDLIDAGLKFQK